MPNSAGCCLYKLPVFKPYLKKIYSAKAGSSKTFLATFYFEKRAEHLFMETHRCSRACKTTAARGTKIHRVLIDKYFFRNMILTQPVKRLLGRSSWLLGRKCIEQCEQIGNAAWCHWNNGDLPWARNL